MRAQDKAIIDHVPVGASLALVTRRLKYRQNIQDQMLKAAKGAIQADIQASTLAANIVSYESGKTDVLPLRQEIDGDVKTALHGSGKMPVMNVQGLTDGVAKENSVLPNGNKMDKSVTGAVLLRHGSDARKRLLEGAGVIGYGSPAMREVFQPQISVQVDSIVINAIQAGLASLSGPAPVLQITKAEPLRVVNLEEYQRMEDHDHGIPGRGHG